MLGAPSFMLRVEMHDFGRQAEFYECSICGAAIVETSRGDSARLLHGRWHGANAIGLG